MSRTADERDHVAGPPPDLPPWLTDRARDALGHSEDGCSPVTAVALPTLLVFAARHPAYLRVRRDAVEQLARGARWCRPLPRLV